MRMTALKKFHLMMESTVTRKTKTKLRIPPSSGLRPGWEWGQASGPCEGLGPPPTQASVTEGCGKARKRPRSMYSERGAREGREGASLHLLGLTAWGCVSGFFNMAQHGLDLSPPKSGSCAFSICSHP